MAAVRHGLDLRCGFVLELIVSKQESLQLRERRVRNALPAVRAEHAMIRALAVQFAEIKGKRGPTIPRPNVRARRAGIQDAEAENKGYKLYQLGNVFNLMPCPLIMTEPVITRMCRLIVNHTKLIEQFPLGSGGH